MIKTVMVPVAWEMTQEEAFVSQAKGELDKIKAERMQEKENQEQELADLLASGYQIITCQVVNAARRTILTFVMYKPASQS